MTNTEAMIIGGGAALSAMYARRIASDLWTIARVKFSLWRIRRHYKKHPEPGPDQIPQHINCRCVIIPIKDEE